MIRCIIIEDEPPARKVLSKYISDVPFLSLAGSYSNAIKAMEDLNENEIDLMFLDINLPKISGLNFLRSMKSPPQVIITTAYSEYALEGFELDVVDYLLKPISFERFLQAVSKLKTGKSPVDASTGLSQTDTEDFRKETTNTVSPSFTFIKSDNSIYRIDFSDIQYIESDEDYVKIHTSEEMYHLRQTLKYWDERLPDEQFVRVHKSFIVNLSKIEHISGNRIVLSGTNVPIGRSYKQNFFEKVERLM